MKNRRGLLQLEGLTERIVPAVNIRSVDGDLVISGIANATGTSPSPIVQSLFISVTGDNQVAIRDGGTSASSGTNRGTYTVTGDLILNLSNRNDSVIIDFGSTALSNYTLDGSIIANLYNGNDSLTISNSGAKDNTISGDIIVDGGNGTDTFTLTNSGLTTSTLSVTGAVSFNGGAGSDVLNANNSTANPTAGSEVATLNIGNGMVVTRVNQFYVGTGGASRITAPVNIDGNITYNASSDKLIENTVTLGKGTTTDAVTLAGALTLTGGSGKDTVNFFNTNIVDVIPAEDTVIEVNVNLGLGENELHLSKTQIGISGTDADFAYTGGTGKDTVDLTGGGNSVSGSVTVTLGKGENLYDDDATAYDKSVTITGGDNKDTVNMNLATIGGLLSVSLGKGENGLDLNSGSAVAGGLTYVGGSGVDTVNIDTGDDLAGDVTISLGTGGDTLTLLGFTSGGETVTSITIDLGVDSVRDNVTYDADLATDGLWTDPLNLGHDDNVHQ